MRRLVFSFNNSSVGRGVPCRHLILSWHRFITIKQISESESLKKDLESAVKSFTCSLALCELAQGYYFSRPFTAGRTADVLREANDAIAASYAIAPIGDPQLARP
jgi:hypothetical protein